MNSRERLLRVLEREKVDRMPVSPFIYENFVREFFKDNNADIISGTVEVYDYFGFDIMHRNCSIDDAFSERINDSANWRVRETTEDNGNERFITTTITTPERQLKQVVKQERVYEYLMVQANMEHYIKCREDFDQFIKYQPPVPTYDCSAIKRAKALVGDKGITAPWASGAFNIVTHMRRLDEIIMDAYIDPDFYNGMMTYFGERTLKGMKQFKDAGADILTYGGNIGNASLVGPNFFREFVLEYEKRIVKEIQDYGLPVLYHNCGDAASLLAMYNEVGFRAYESLTPPPYGDTDLDKALDILDKDMVLLGNIDQIDLLRKGSKDDIEQTVWILAEKAKTRGNFILATTDYFNENTPFENIKAFAEAGLKYGRYY